MAVDSTKNTLYISQRAANSIIADVAPYRISSEALLAINTFLDEFLYFLVDSARSLELIRIKLAIGQVLPTSLGKNAIGEAELELKTYVESGNSDHTKEKTIEITPFPLQKVFEQFRVKCQFFSTLGERGADDRDPNSVPDLYASEGIHIAPSLAIYLTAVLEYVGEYILIRVAKASEKKGVEVARAQEVYSALSEDSQIFPLFRRTNLKEQMEPQFENTKNNSTKGSATSKLSKHFSSESSTKSPKAGYTQSSILYSPTKSSSHSGGGRQITLDEPGNDWKKGPTSPVRLSNDYNGQSSENKNVGMRSTKSMQSLGQLDKEPDLRNVSSMEDNREKMRSFETLISSNQTMKVSLTPNRLITIEEHKRPPRLAPREPVSRERIIQTSSPSSPSKLDEFDDDDEELFGKRKPKKDKEESLWEFLKNTSPDDVLGDKVRKKDTRMDLSRRRGKNIDKLESVSEKPKSPGSPGNKPRYTPLIPSAKSPPSSPYQPDRVNATINQKISSSDGRSHVTSPTSSTYLSPSLHHSKSLDQTQSSYYQNSQATKSAGYVQSSTKSLPSIPKPRPNLDSMDDDDDDLLYPQGQKKPKRRHEAQDLIDFLNSSPPKEYSIVDNGTNNNDVDIGKKKEKKLKKLLSKLKKPSFIDESTSSLNGQRLTNSSINSFSTTSTYGSNSTANTLINKPARYIKIEIPKILPKEDNQEQSIFDQVEIQGRHARQISRASLSGSTRSQFTPNRSTFSTTGGMTSPTTILEKKPSDSKSNANDYSEYNEYMGITTRASQKSENTQQSSLTNTSTLSQPNTNNVSAHKNLSPVSPSRQKPSYNNNVVNKNNNNQTPSQGINKVTPDLPKDQKLDVSETSSSKKKPQYTPAKTLQNFIPSEGSSSVNNKNIINENEKVEVREAQKVSIPVQNKEVVQMKPKEVVVSKESAQNKVVVQTKPKEVVVSKEFVQNQAVQMKFKEVASKEPAQNKEVVQTKPKVVVPKDFVQNRIDQMKSKEAASKESAQNKEVAQTRSKVIASKEPLQSKEVVQTKPEVVQTKPKVVVPKEFVQNKVAQTKSKEVASKESAQNTEVAQTRPKKVIASKEPAQNEVVQTKSKEVTVSKESVQNEEIITHDDFLVSVIEAKIIQDVIQDVQEEITIVTCNEELEEAFVVEWLLGTGLTFKSAMTYVDFYEDEEVPEMEKSEYEDADDSEFIDDHDEQHITTGTGRDAITGNVVQVGA